MDILSYTPEIFIENEENILQQLQDPEIWQKIPLLNANELHHLKENSLVRFYGMIQDMYSPEYYLEKYEVTNKLTNEKTVRNGKYLDAIKSGDQEEVDLNSDENVTSERQTYVVISVPGVNQWVQDIEQEKYKVNIPEICTNTSQKRSHDEAMESEDIEHRADKQEKKPCNLNIKKEENTRLVSTEHILNLPLPNRTGKTCHVKVYKNAETLKLNDTCEFMGFLAIDPIFESLYQDDDTENKMEVETHHPPSSLVPRIHCITFKPLKHINPLVGDDTVMDESRFLYIFKELLLVLTQLMVGDYLSAEYLIYHLISEVYLRRDLMPLGKFSLNISNVPKIDGVDFPSEIYKFIEAMIPKSHYLPMTLENMNELSFVPKKDYECDRLTSGILQLSANTHVLLDETKLRPGKLDVAGVDSVRAISNVIKHQKLAYDFNYYPIEYDCDIPFLIFSEGKSMLATDVTVVLKPDQISLDTFKEILVAARYFLKPELLDDIRKYLTLARLVKYDISENVQDLVQEEFVSMRQRGAVSADDLHRLLVLARMVSIARGKKTLDKECWEKALNLEKARRERLPKNKYTLKQNNVIVESASEEDLLQTEEDLSTECNDIPNVQKNTQKDTETETVSCYCSASHTDNLSTDEHDSLRDTQDGASRGIQASDSGADLTECLKQDVETDWHQFWSLNGEKLIWESWIAKYSAYINSDYFQQTGDSGAVLLSGNEKQSKYDKFSFDDKDVQSFTSEQSRPEKDKVDTKIPPLIRTLSGSDEKLFTEVSEGWNPLSPLSVDCETDQERLLSSRCGSHASSSLRTIDSMTNVTRMTVSSVDLSSSTSSSDSFSSVSSVHSSISSEDSEEDYQNQWNLLWKQHYEEEYLLQYNNYLCLKLAKKSSFEESKSIPITAPHLMSSSSADSQIANALIDIMNSLKVAESKEKSESEQEQTTSYQCNIPEDDVNEMVAMGLPLAFGDVKCKISSPSETNKHSTLQKADSFEAGRSRIKAAFDLMGIEFQDNAEQRMSGQVDYKMKHIRLQNRHLKINAKLNKKPKHVYFDDDGNTIQADCDEVIHSILSDSSDNSGDEEQTMEVQKGDKSMVKKVTKAKRKRKKKNAFPPEIRENPKLRKYWQRRFSLFSKFDQGIKLDEESWYSVTPEQVAKHAAERCQCDVIIDAFCGAGGNAIQFALTCKRVIAIDIDEKKIEIAKNNAEVYGVSDKIDFIVGDFLKLAETLRADTVFLSPPWGGPSYLNQAVYDLENMLEPVSLTDLLQKSRLISKNVAIFLPRNSNTNALVMATGPGGKVEIEQDFINKKLIAITAYYSDLIKQK